MAQQTITALFDRYDDAGEAVAKLESGGIPHANVSIVSNNEGDRHAGRPRGARAWSPTGPGRRAPAAGRAPRR